MSSSDLLEILKITQMLQSYVLARLERDSLSGEQGSLHKSQRGVGSESRVYPRHNSFGRGPGHNSFGRELPGEGGQSQRLPDSPSSWYSLSGEQGSLKDSLGEYDIRLSPCKEGDVTNSGEQESLKDFLSEYDIRLSPCKKGDVTSSGEQESLKDSLGEYDTRLHPCEEGDVLEVQGGSGDYKTPRVSGVTPMKPIMFRTRIFVSSSRRKKPESSTRSSVEEEKYPKIRQNGKFFPRGRWNVTEKELLVTSGQHI